MSLCSGFIRIKIDGYLTCNRFICIQPSLKGTYKNDNNHKTQYCDILWYAAELYIIFCDGISFSWITVPKSVLFLEKRLLIV